MDLDLRQFEIPPEHIYKDDFGQKLSFYKKFQEQLKLKKKETEDMMNIMRADLDYIKDYLECEKAFIDDAKARQALEIAEELAKLRALLDDHREDVINPIKRQIRLLERQLNKLGRVQEKLAVFSRVIKRKGILLRVRHLFDVFSENDLRIKVKVFDDKNNVVDDFGNVCVFKTRRLEDHSKRYHSLREFMEKLKSRFG
jgi:DNA repair exonuclease SbcCD ATPase subunit